MLLDGKSVMLTLVAAMLSFHPLLRLGHGLELDGLALAMAIVAGVCLLSLIVVIYLTTYSQLLSRCLWGLLLYFAYTLVWVLPVTILSLIGDGWVEPVKFFVALSGGGMVAIFLIVQLLLRLPAIGYARRDKPY